MSLAGMPSLISRKAQSVTLINIARLEANKIVSVTVYVLYLSRVLANSWHMNPSAH